MPFDNAEFHEVHVHRVEVTVANGRVTETYAEACPKHPEEKPISRFHVGGEHEGGWTASCATCRSPLTIFAASFPAVGS